ncbi:MAG: glycine zipper domain-containing protein [Gammaproteobacteria bacterium]|nr:glycine zipper domain-containing protein [Gammaproteobacteria bacterium]
MTRLSNVFVVSAVVLAAECLTINLAYAEGEKSIAASLDVQVFPSDGQASSQQSKDEGACYDWAVQNTGVDPFKLSKDEQAQAPPPAEAQSSQRGAGLRGGLRGAAAGAVVGEIVDDDASKGAAIGATVGAIGARRKARGAEQAAASEQQLGSFKKGFAACLKGKKYTVEY